MDYKKVMVPLDGSDNSELAFKRSMEFVQEVGTSLYLVHVIDTMPLVGNYGVVSGDLFYDLSERAREYLEQMKLQAEKWGAQDVSIHVRFGNPKTVIAKVGSVAEYVNRHAPVDVMVIKK